MMPLPSPSTVRLPDPSNPDGCTPQTCPVHCGLEVIDHLLQSTGGVGGEDVDALLDLRWLLHHRQDAENALALFCQLRRRLEQRQYLAFYRLRRWLENHIEAQAVSTEGRSHAPVALHLTNYCLEAVRSRCLLSARLAGVRPVPGRIEFAFRALTSQGLPETSPRPLGAVHT